MNKILRVFTYLGTEHVVALTGFAYGIYNIYNTTDPKRTPLSSCLAAGIAGSLYSAGAVFVGQMVNPYGAIVPISIGYSVLTDIRDRGTKK